MTCYSRKVSNDGTTLVYINTGYHITFLGVRLYLHNDLGCMHVTLRLDKDNELWTQKNSEYDYQ